MSVSNEITRIKNAKSAISTAITNKGVSVPSGTKLDGMAALIGQIEQGGGAEMVSGQISTGGDMFTIHYTDESGYHRIENFAVNITCPKDSLIFIENSASFAWGGNMTGAEIVYVHTYEEWVEVIGGYETYADALIRIKNDKFTIYP